MFSAESNRIKNHLTILFLVVFTLIKISPDYFLCQFTPQSERTGLKEFTKTHTENTKSHADFKVRADKAIDDKTEASLIPAIKFTGIPFEIFFLGLFLVQAKLTDPLPGISSFSSEASATPCILRL